MVLLRRGRNIARDSSRSERILPHSATELIHRWRRHILHASACAAIVASGCVGLLSAPGAGLAVSKRVSPVRDAAAAIEAPALMPLPEPALLGVADTLAPDAPIQPAPELAAAVDPVATRSYTVEPGDSVKSIARQFGVTNETIIWENDLTDPDYVMVGQELRILPFSGLIHEVRPGDTVASVANSYEAKVEDVVSANHLLPPYIIVVGQKLAVPGGYRPLPQKIVVAPAAAVARPAPADTLEAPPAEDDQQAASVSSPKPPRKRTLPVLGGTPQEQFIASIAEAAVESQAQTGVPASVTIAQAILESYWGSSRLAREANNYFGIKAQTRSGPAGVVWFDVWEVIGGRNVMQSEPFRVYHTAAESFVDHGRFLVENGRYAAAFAARGDARQFARAINAAGYATDPGYAGKLIGLMDRYDLYRFDDV